MPSGLTKRPREIEPASGEWRVTRPESKQAELPALRSLPLIEDDQLVDLLRSASNEMLAPLVELLCKKGRPTSKLEQTENYRRYVPDHRKYVNEIAAEIQRYGANDIASLFREGKGVRYSEITRDVAKRLGLRRWRRDTEKLEDEIVEKIFCDACERLTPEQQVEILRSLRVRNLSGAGKPLSVMTLRATVNCAGFPAYQATVIVANGTTQSILGHGLSFTTNWVLTKGLSIFAGPLGMAFAAVLAANMFAGPAYRVTVPCVIQVALIRREIQRQRQIGFVQWAVGLLIGAALALLLYFLLKRWSAL